MSGRPATPTGEAKTDVNGGGTRLVEPATLIIRAEVEERTVRLTDSVSQEKYEYAVE